MITKFAGIKLTTGRNAPTAVSIFESVDNFFSTNNISWDDCVGLGLDNTNANIGHNSIKTRTKRTNPNIVICGYPCHILHNACGNMLLLHLHIHVVLI